MFRALSAVAVLLGWVAAAAVLVLYFVFETNLLKRDPGASAMVAAAAVLACCTGSVVLWVKRRHLFAILTAWVPPVLAVGAFTVRQEYTSSDAPVRMVALQPRELETPLPDLLRDLASQEEVYRAAHGAYVGDLDTLGAFVDKQFITVTFVSATATGWSARAAFTDPDMPTWRCVIAVGAAPLPPYDAPIPTDSTGVDPEKTRPPGLSTNDVNRPTRVAATRVDTTRVEGGPGGTMVCASK